MIAFAWIVLLAATTRIELVNQDYQIAPADWQWVPVSLKQQAGMMEARFETQPGSGLVRLVLMRRQDLDDMPHGALALTGRGASGDLGQYIQEPGDYALVVDNRESRQAANVHLSVWMDFVRRRTRVQTASRERQMTVILVSFAVFFAIVGWSAKRLLGAVRR